MTPDDAAGLFAATGWRGVESADSAARVRNAGFVLLEPE
jgi:hypothetical protein